VQEVVERIDARHFHVAVGREIARRIEQRVRIAVLRASHTAGMSFIARVFNAQGFGSLVAHNKISYLFGAARFPISIWLAVRPWLRSCSTPSSLCAPSRSTRRYRARNFARTVDEELREWTNGAPLQCNDPYGTR